MRIALASLVLLVLPSIVFGPSGAVAQSEWHDEWQFFPRPSFPHSVHDAVLLDDQLVVGGFFTSVHDVAARSVARWNGRAWEALGAGANGRVNALAMYGGDLVNAHDSGGVAHVALFDGGAWHALGTFEDTGGSASIVDVLVIGSTLYVGGRFDRIDGVDVPRGLAAFDGTSWSAVGSGPGDDVTALGVWQGDLVVAGDFTVTGGGVADHIARWTGSQWTAIGGGTPSAARCLIEFAGELWAGLRSSSGVSDGALVRRFDGQAWAGADNGFESLFDRFLSPASVIVLDFAVFDGQLHVGGTFGTGFTSPGPIAGRWNGTAWERLGTFGGYAEDFAPAWEVNVLVPWADRLVLAGLFPRTEDRSIENIVAWTGSTFERVADDELGTDAGVTTIALADDGVVVGGRFDEAGSVATGPIARWDGFRWHPYGFVPTQRLDGTVVDVLVDGTELVVVGFFRFPDGTEGLVGRWDGTAWSPLGEQQFNASSATAVIRFEGDVVVAANGVHRWTDSSWERLGATLPSDPVVFDLVEYDGQLHALGALDFFTPSPRIGVFRYESASGTWTSIAPDGTAAGGWAAVGAVHDGELLVGGTLEGVGDLSSPGLVAWDGSSWSARTTSMDRGVLAIASTARGLIIGGDFREIDGEAIRAVARHDPVGGWVDVEGSPSARVGALLPRLGSVWMGGDFLGTADGSSEGVIVWHPILATGVDGPITPRVSGVESVFPNPFNPQTTVRLAMARAGAATVQVFDVRGRRVRTLLDGAVEAGRHDLVWDGTDDAGRAVSSGVYFVRAVHRDGVDRHRVSLVK